MNPTDALRVDDQSFNNSRIKFRKLCCSLSNEKIFLLYKKSSFLDLFCAGSWSASPSPSSEQSSAVWRPRWEGSQTYSDTSLWRERGGWMKNCRWGSLTSSGAKNVAHTMLPKCSLASLVFQISTAGHRRGSQCHSEALDCKETESHPEHFRQS